VAANTGSANTRVHFQKRLCTVYVIKEDIYSDVCCKNRKGKNILLSLRVFSFKETPKHVVRSVNIQVSSHAPTMTSLLS